MHSFSSDHTRLNTYLRYLRFIQTTKFMCMDLRGYLGFVTTSSVRTGLCFMETYRRYIWEMKVEKINFDVGPIWKTLYPHKNFQSDRDSNNTHKEIFTSQIPVWLTLVENWFNEEFRVPMPIVSILDFSCNHMTHTSLNSTAVVSLNKLFSM